MTQILVWRVDDLFCFITVITWRNNGSWVAIILQENWIGGRCEFLQFSPYSVGVYYFCTVEWYCLCKYPDIKLYGHHEMVAEDSILPASKTLALAQWKILLIFFSYHNYFIQGWQKDVGHRAETYLNSFWVDILSLFQSGDTVEYVHHNIWGRCVMAVLLIQVIYLKSVSKSC